jgi:2-dehydro-3-deoxyphosphogluconate aldolase / (4S)-4-hydroxy-2-oxoglutarate aldolase
MVLANENRTIEQTVAEILEDGAFLAVRLGAGAPVVEACRAAVRGGLRVLELTLTTPGALEAIEALSGEKGVVAGAGTVLRPEQVREVAARGGRFVLSPVHDPAVLHEAERLGLLAVPGGATPTEIYNAYRSGARLVKFFPAGALGGPEFIRTFRGPFPDVPLVPTSGPNAENLHEYLAAGAVAVGVGREVFPPGYSLRSIEAASGRVREALDAARSR